MTSNTRIPGRGFLHSPGPGLQKKISGSVFGHCALLLAGVLSLQLFTACAPPKVRMGGTYWPNGQLAVLVGPSDSRGRREGLWVYYDENGRELDFAQFAKNPPIEGTGYYSAGLRIRSATEEELAEAKKRAEALNQVWK